MNTQKFNQIVSEAKAKAANSPAWQRCLDKAAKMLENGELVATVLADGVLVTSPNGSYYVTAGHCPCAARTAHCYHRCAARIATLMDAEETARRVPGEWSLGEYETLPQVICKGDEEEVASAATFAADVENSSRANLIAEIENIWPRFAPGVPLYTELLARFGKSHLDMLDDGCLKAVRLAIAL